MGIYDRDYQRYEYSQQPGFHVTSPQSMTVRLVIVNVVVYLAQLMFEQQGFSHLFSLQSDWYLQPWRFFELLTYGFLHATQGQGAMWHIVGNMFVLWMFGRFVEQRYGSKEFLALYLTAIVFAGLSWTLCEFVVPGRPATMLGASGGVSAVLLLFIFNYPKVTVLFMFFIPMPAWVLGVIIVGQDMLGAVGGGGDVAFTAHLGGFLFALLYHQSGIQLLDYIPGVGGGFRAPKLRRGPKLKVHQPKREPESDPLDQEVDRILKKIQQQGQDSLTRRERQLLEKASRAYQERRS